MLPLAYHLKDNIDRLQMQLFRISNNIFFKKRAKTNWKTKNKNNLKTEVGRKTIVWILQMTKETAHETTSTWLRRGKLKQKTTSALITAQDNTLCIDYDKEKINSTQKNRKYILCGETEKTVNHIKKKISYKRNASLGTPEWERWSTGNYARD